MGSLSIQLSDSSRVSEMKWLTYATGPKLRPGIPGTQVQDAVAGSPVGVRTVGGGANADSTALGQANRLRRASIWSVKARQRSRRSSTYLGSK